MVEKNHWLREDPTWQGMSPTRKAAVMALLEDGNTTGAYHVAGAIVNRVEADSARLGKPVNIGEHVSTDTYQPNFDITAKERYKKLLSDPRVDKIQGWIEQRQAGMTPDNVNGATHFLEDPKTMKALQAGDPSYKNWGSGGQNWSAHNPNLPDSAPYGYETFRPNVEGRGHRFLRPIEYGGSVNYDPVQVAVGATGGTPEANGSQPTSGAGAGVMPAINPHGALLPSARRFDPSNFAPVQPTAAPEQPPLPGSPTPQTQNGNPISALRQLLGLPASGAAKGSPHSFLNMATGGAPAQGSIFQGLNALFGGEQPADGAAGGAAGGAAPQGHVPASVLALQAAPKPAEIAASPIIQGAPIAHGWNPGAFAQAPQLGWLNVNPFTFGLPPRQG